MTSQSQLKVNTMYSATSWREYFPFGVYLPFAF